MYHNRIALAFAFLALVSASTFLENPKKSSIETAGAVPETVATAAKASTKVDADAVAEDTGAHVKEELDKMFDSKDNVQDVDNSESADAVESSPADAQEDDGVETDSSEDEDDVNGVEDVSLLDEGVTASDADDQDADVKDSEISEDDTSAEGTEQADDSTETSDGDEEGADELETDEAPVAAEGASFLEDGDSTDIPDADADIDLNVPAADDDSLDSIPAMGDEDDMSSMISSAVDDLDATQGIPDDVSTMSEDISKSDDTLEQEVENLDVAAMSKEMSKELVNDSKEHAVLEAAESSQTGEKAEHVVWSLKSAESSQTSEKATKNQAAEAVPLAAESQAKDKTLMSGDEDKLFQNLKMYISDLKYKVYSGPKFKVKVDTLCKKYSDWAKCDETMKEVVFCNLLKRSEPKAAEKMCAGVSLDPSTYFPKAEKKIASLYSTSSSLQVDMVEELAAEMAHDLDVNFDEIAVL